MVALRGEGGGSAAGESAAVGVAVTIYFDLEDLEVVRRWKKPRASALRLIVLGLRGVDPIEMDEQAEVEQKTNRAGGGRGQDDGFITSQEGVHRGGEEPQL